MAKGAGPTTEQLLELLKRAAEELKSVQATKETLEKLEPELDAAHARLEQVETQLSTVSAELKVERAKAAEASAAADGALAQEKEKHQQTAQKLLEARSRVRELESQGAAQLERLGGMEKAAAASHEEHAQALGASEQKQRQQLAELSARLAETQGQLEHASTNWQQVERAYESLHREMLLVLEQRDEARKLLPKSP